MAGERPHQPVFARQSRKPSAGAQPQTAAAPPRDRQAAGGTREKGLALIPTKIYLKGAASSARSAVAKGKKLHDKRETERNRTAEEEARAEMRRRA